MLILIAFLYAFHGYTQNDNVAPIDLGAIGNLSPETEKKMNAAFGIIDAVEKAGNYIKALSDLFSDGQLTLPVGIKAGDYTLAVDKITMDENGRPRSA